MAPTDNVGWPSSNGDHVTLLAVVAAAFVDLQSPPVAPLRYTVFPVASAGSTKSAVTRPTTGP